MTQPVVVVQGTAVGNPYGATPHQQQHEPYPGGGVMGVATGGEGSGAVAFTKGEKQATRCRDPLFALLFYACVIAIVALAVTNGKDVLDKTADNDSGYDYDEYIYALLCTGAVSLIFSGLGMAFIFRFPSISIKAALIFSVALSGLFMVVSFLSGSLFAAVIGLVFFMMSLCYAYFAWSRIPFATMNLVTAITAVKANLGVTVVAYFFTVVAAAWTLVWAIAFVGVWDSTYSCDANSVCSDPNYGILFLLFLPYFFAQQVLQACIHVTVAGVVGTWWFAPEEGNSCCSPAVRDSLCRTVTTSFGSICFGSLLVAILQTLRMLAQNARDNDNCAIVACIFECILDCLASIIEYFNKWAFIYVGLYGYSYMEAGKNVFTLFQNRGWEAIIADDLIANVLTLVSLVVALIMGCVGIILELSTDWFSGDNVPGSPRLVSFLLGFVVGLVLCSVLMSTVGSGVNAVIVLFAEAPAEFQQNHPRLSDRMREVWAVTYPGSII